MANLISISLEATKIKEEEFVDKFISNVNLDFCTLEKIHKKSGYGCKLSTKQATFEELNSSEEFRFILDSLSQNSFKAHDAKNNYLTVSYTVDNSTVNIFKKIDLFILQNMDFCQKLARKDKAFHFNFSEKMFEDLGLNESNNRPVSFNRNEIVFRFFRSTLKFETIMATVEFVKTLYYFILEKQITYEMLFEHSQSLLNKYIKFAKENSIYLNNYLAEKFG